jgi:hypothetical protein
MSDVHRPSLASLLNPEAGSQLVEVADKWSEKLEMSNGRVQPPEEREVVQQLEEHKRKTPSAANIPQNEQQHKLKIEVESPCALEVVVSPPAMGKLMLEETKRSAEESRCGESRSAEEPRSAEESGDAEMAAPVEKRESVEDSGPATTSLASERNVDGESVVVANSRPVVGSVASETTSGSGETVSGDTGGLDVLASAVEPDVLPIDAGIIRCICGFDDDDGFTIQCEKCNAWQHAQCVDIASESEVPETYYCDRCGNRQVDVQAAVERQLKRIHTNSGSKKRRSRTSKPRNNSTQKSGTTTRSASPGHESAEDEGGSNEVFNDSYENNDGTPNVNGAPNGSAAGKKGKRKRMTVEPPLPPPPPPPPQMDNDATDSEPDIDSRFSLSRSLQSQFVNISSCRICSPEVQTYLDKVPSMTLDEDSCSYLTLQEFCHIKPLKVTVKPVSEQSKSRFYGFSRFGVFVDSTIPKDRFIIEFFGEIVMQNDYKQNPINQYRFYGCPKPGVLFVPKLDVCVDARRVGAEASCIRRSCKPNVKFSTIVVQNSHIHFAAFALETIKTGSELTVGWDWDPLHPVHRLMAGDDIETLSKEERQFLVKSSGFIQQRGIECGCNSSPDCIIARMRKADGQGQRNTRSGTRKSYELPDSTASETSPPQQTEAISTTAIYCAREERKLQDTISLIDKLEQEVNNKRKRPESLEPESVVSLSTKAVQTEPVVKKLRSDSLPATEDASPVIAPHKRRLVQFLLAKQEYTTAQQSARSSPSGSPTLSKRPLPETSPHSPSFEVKSPVSQTPRVSNFVVAVQPAAAAPPPGSIQKPVVVKKLSFADYKRKQKPSSTTSAPVSASSSRSGSPARS